MKRMLTAQLILGLFTLIKAQYIMLPIWKVPPYVIQVGKSLPYQALGFRSTTALLEAIPDVCSLQQRNGTLMVVGLPSSGTAHILTMVNRQGKKQVIIKPDYHLITSFSSRGEVGE